MLDMTVQTLLDGLAARKPVPAGVAAAVVAGASGAALGLKVVRVSMTDADPESMRSLEAAAARLQQVLDDLPPRFEEDCAAFGDVIAARRRRPPDRDATAAAWKKATEVPLHVVRLARDGLVAVRSVVDEIRPAVRCDHVAAACLLWTAADIASMTAAANAASIPLDGGALASEARAAREVAAAAYEAVRGTLGPPQNKDQ